MDKMVRKMYDLGKKKKMSFNPSGGTIDEGIKKMKEDMKASYKNQPQGFKPFSTTLRGFREEKKVVKPLVRPVMKQEDVKKEEKQEVWSSEDWLDWAYQLLDDYAEEQLTPMQILPEWVIESYKQKEK